MGATVLGAAMFGLSMVGHHALAQGLTREQLPAQAPAQRFGLNRTSDELPRPIVPANEAQIARALEPIRAAATAAVLRSGSVREAAAVAVEMAVGPAAVAAWAP